MKHILYNLIFPLYLIVCIGLIVAVASQTSKSEGLGGTLGGKTEAATFIRKRTWDERLDRVTSYLAWSFLVLSTAIVLLGF